MRSVNGAAVDAAWLLVGRVQRAQDRLQHCSAYVACRAAGVSVAQYKAARFIVCGLNEAV